MMYAPHILQIRLITQPHKNEYGQNVPGTGGEEWNDVCNCRCDDDTTQQLTSDNAEVYWSHYHIVCSGRNEIMPGSYCRCIDNDGNVRGEGIVRIPKRLNFLPYSELWI